MITRVSRNVICIKDIPSNMIEEAIFILKSNEKQDGNTKINSKRSKELLLKEAEDIVVEYNDKFQNEHNKKNRIEKYKKIQKKKMQIGAIALATLFVIICVLFSVIK